jgi:hypothetical protein
MKTQEQHNFIKLLKNQQIKPTKKLTKGEDLTRQAQSDVLDMFRFPAY